MTTTYKNAAAHRNAIMPEMADKPMSVVVEFMAKNVMIKGKPMGAAKAKAYYIDGVKRLAVMVSLTVESTSATAAPTTSRLAISSHHPTSGVHPRSRPPVPDRRARTSAMVHGVVSPASTAEHRSSRITQTRGDPQRSARQEHCLLR